MHSSDSAKAGVVPDQRVQDRRKEQIEFDGPDRRERDRREGFDRRKHNRRGADA